MRTSKYLTAAVTSKIERSDFILLSTAWLESKTHEAKEETSIERLQEIRQHYAFGRYDEAVQLILESGLPPEINASQLFDTLTDDPYANLSRRYFDTVLSLNTWEMQETPAIQSIQKFHDFMHGIDPHIVPTMTLDTPMDAKKTLALVRNIGEEVPSIMAIWGPVRDQSALSKSKDRGSDMTKVMQDTRLYSQNPGILRAISPVPQHLLLEEPVTNKITDRFFIDPSIKGGYSKSRPHTPFVNSVSGTAYAFAAILMSYMQEHKDDETLDRDVDAIITAFLSFVCMQGYHSMAEMTDALDDYFRHFGLPNINYQNNIFRDSLLEQAFQESADYVMQIAQRRLIHRSILTGSSLSSSQTATLWGSMQPVSLPPQTEHETSQNNNRSAKTEKHIVRALTAHF